MALTSRYAAQCCVRQLRASATVRVSSSFLQHSISRRHNSTEAAADPKIATIVDQISQLTLLETADLVSSLKVALYLFSRGTQPWIIADDFYYSLD